MTNDTYYAVPCDVRWPNNDHAPCGKCGGSGRVPIVAPHTNDQLLQWLVGAVLVIVAGLAVLAVWVKR